MRKIYKPNIIINKKSKINDPEELLVYMNNNFKYKQGSGYTSYKQIIKDGITNCWGAADFAFKIFKDLKLKTVIVYLSIGDPPERTHSATLFKRDDKWYWFEWAWSKSEGINGPYSSINKAKQAINEVFTDEYGKPDVEEVHWHLIGREGMTDNYYINKASCLFDNFSHK